MKQSQKILCQLTLSLILILSSVFSLHAQDFEGVIYYKVPEMEKQGMNELPYMIKGDKIRMELGDGAQQGAMLILPEEKQMVLIIEEMKGFMAIDLNESVDSESSNPYQNSTMTKTGDIKTIAGKDCEVWNITSDESDFETCMAEGIGSFRMPGDPMNHRNAPAWAKEVMKNGLMPLEVVELRKNGSKVLQMIATQIEQKPLDPALFEVPKEYRDMSGMMQQMMKKNH